MILARGDYIGGRFAALDAADGEIVRASPADTRETIGRFPFAAAQVDRAVEAARSAQTAWGRAPIAERAAALGRLKGALAARAGELAHLIAVEVGKPLWEARAEVAGLATKIDVNLREGLAEIAPREIGAVRGAIEWRPLGVVAILGPFNFPAHLVHGQVVPALLAGNAVVVKPSELAPATGQLYAEALDAARLPPGVANLVQGDGASGARLAAHAGVDGVLFTGSWGTGRRILEATLDQPGKLVALEMGGKNAAVVLRDADLDLAAVEIAQGAYATAGQRCTASSRVIVERPVADALIERLARIARTLRVGHPLDDPFMGPMISEPARDRFLAALASARDEADPIVPPGPRDVGRPGAYISPSLHLVRARGATAYQREELFGPDAQIHVVDSLDEALAVHDATPYGLVCALFTRDDAAWAELRARVRAGVVHRNRTTVGTSGRLPFGGLGRSGNHRPGGVFMIRACAAPVAVMEGEGTVDVKRLPPGLVSP